MQIAFSQGYDGIKVGFNSTSNLWGVFDLSSRIDG